MASASATFAGLVLVFFGLSISGFDAFSDDQKGAVQWLYRRRAWPAFAALLASLSSCGASLYAKAAQCVEAARVGAALLGFVGVAICLSGLLTLLEIG